MSNYSAISKKFIPIKRKNDVYAGELVWIEVPDNSDPCGTRAILEGPYLVIRVNRNPQELADTIIYIETDTGKNKSCFCDWAFKLA